MNLLDLQSDPAAFRDALLIDTDGGPRPFRDVVDDWQTKDFAALDSGWRRAVLGSSHEATHQRAWLERPRGHSKSQDLGVMAAWALFASRRRLSLIGCAADQDQARLLRDAVGKLVFCNPWLSRLIEVQNLRVVNPITESSLDIISSDARSSYGLTPDGIICDEVVHWKSRDLWDSMFSSAAKRSTCMLVVITNAGLSDDWQYKTREAVRSDPGWYFSRLEGPQASWITPNLLAEQERLLPSVAYQRLWLNQWTTGGGDALTRELIDAAFVPDLQAQPAAVPGFEYVAGLDLGVSRDASAVCVLGVRRDHAGHGRIRFAHTRVWRPAKGMKVDLQTVEDFLFDLHARFGLKQLNFDPWEARHMASRLQSGGMGRLAKSRLDAYGRAPADRPSLPVVEVSPSGKNLQAVATAVIEAFNDRRVELYPEPDLHRDLTRFRVEERSYGFRLTSPHDEHGHGDLGTAFSLAMLAASELAGKRVVVAGALSDVPLGVAATPMQRAMAQFEAEQRRYAAEQERMARNDPDDLAWQALMGACRRAGTEALNRYLGRY
jgi:hypothetical protein